MTYSEALSKPLIAKNDSYNYDYYCSFKSFLTFVSLFSYFLSYCRIILSFRRLAKSFLVTFISLFRAYCELLERFTVVFSLKEEMLDCIFGRSVTTYFFTSEVGVVIL